MDSLLKETDRARENRANHTEKRISKLEDRNLEMIQIEEKINIKKREEKNGDILTQLL